MRYYYQEIGRLWQVVGILVTGKRRLQDRVTDAYEYMVVSLHDRMPEDMRVQFETLCKKFVEEGNKASAEAHGYPRNAIDAARMWMAPGKAREFAKSIFELCRDAIESAHREHEKGES